MTIKKAISILKASIKFEEGFIVKHKNDMPLKNKEAEFLRKNLMSISKARVSYLNAILKELENSSKISKSS